MQLGQPVTFASRAPTLAERKYSQIWKELLAQVFGMDHNHHHDCVCSEGHPLDRSQTISLHFMEASGISFQETTAPTVTASTIWLWNTLQAWQGDAASWYPVKSLFRGLWAISHRIRGGVHPRHSFLPVPDHHLKELHRETACDPIVQFGKESNLGLLPRYNGWTNSSHSPVPCFLK